MRCWSRKNISTSNFQISLNTLACAQYSSRTAFLACSQFASRTEAPSNGLRKYHRRERTNGGTEERTNPHSHVDFFNLIIYVSPYCCSIVCDRPISVFPQYRRVCILSSNTLKQVNRQTCNVSADSKSGLSPRSPVSESLML